MTQQDVDASEARAAQELKEPEDSLSRDQAPLEQEEVEKVFALLNSLESEEERAFCDYRCARRYLRARGWNLEKALKSLRETVAWRKEFGVDTLAVDHLDQLKLQSQSGKMLQCGKDPHGHPIINMHSVREKLYDHDGSMRLLVYTLERAISQMEDGVEKVVLCIDMVGYSISNAPPMKTSRMTLWILQNMYVERLERALIFQPGWAFATFWSAISLFIDPVTKNKVVMVKDKKLEDKHKRMQEYVDADQLCEEFGGKLVSPFKGDTLNEYWNDEEVRVAQAREAAGGHPEERDEDTQ